MEQSHNELESTIDLVNGWIRHNYHGTQIKQMKEPKEIIYIDCTYRMTPTHAATTDEAQANASRYKQQLYVFRSNSMCEAFNRSINVSSPISIYESLSAYPSLPSNTKQMQSLMEKDNSKLQYVYLFNPCTK